MSEKETQQVQLDGGTYEILKNRLQKSGQELRTRLGQLNTSRKEVFGAIETRLIATERISTANNCVPRDMVPVGNHFIFGYNVMLGLKSETQLSDVFSIYRYDADHTFHEASLELLEDKTFQDDLRKLYKYYRETQFQKFTVIGMHLYMVFRTGKNDNDLKAFKWLIKGGKLTYIDNRSEHEVVYPPQHEFEWVRTTREQHRQGQHPHISIEDRIFVETVGGDLTIKIEDNTEDGQGIYAEEVEHKDQSLDDAEIFYAIVGSNIILKIKPYREEDYRYIIYNEKIQEARRVDTIADACVLLPSDHGLIFANGYYLQTGEFKYFDIQLEDMRFVKRVASPNGEDFLYVFFNKKEGAYLLLSYNLIEQRVDNPILCHGYAIFENGELLYFRGEDTPKKHHAIQIWQTAFIGPDYELPQAGESYLYKIGNKDIVQAMAECHEILTLLQKEDSYSGLYFDLIKLTTDLNDSYHWLTHEEAFKLSEPVAQIRETATAAVDEFDKISRIKKNTESESKRVFEQADDLVRRIKRQTPSHINEFVGFLAELRAVRGEVISLKDLRYSDTETIEASEKEIEKFTQQLSNDCVEFLLKDEALQPYEEKVAGIKDSVENVKKVSDAKQIGEDIDQVSGELEMLIEIVSSLQIEDATQTTRIIDSISAIYSSFNQIKAALKRRTKELMGEEGKAEFNAQLKLIDQGVVNYLDICDTPEKCEEYLTKLMIQLEELEGKFSEFNDFIEKISQVREEVYNAFESRKIQLTEARNKRANTLLQAADRIIKAVQSRVARFKTVSEINGYFASDLMIEKVRGIVRELSELGDSVKAEDVQSRLKTAREDAARQLKDKNELFVDGENLIKFGKYHFAVNTQNLGLTIVEKNGEMYYHLTGTGFFEKIADDDFNACREVWTQNTVSENNEVYRGEYLAWKILQAAYKPEQEKNLSVDALYKLTDEQLLEYIQQFMAVRYQENYIKGVHDQDAQIILKALLRMIKTSDLLRFDTTSRSAAAMYWKLFAEQDIKERFDYLLKGASAILKVFPETHEFDNIKKELQDALNAFAEDKKLFAKEKIADAGEYLFYELTRGEEFIIDAQAASLYQAFTDYLKRERSLKHFEESIKSMGKAPELQFGLILHWLKAFAAQAGLMDKLSHLEETAALLLTNGFDREKVIHVSLSEQLEALQGSHDRIEERAYQLHYNEYVVRMRQFDNHTVPLFNHFTQLKKEMAVNFEKDLRLNEFKPRVMASFVRNKLIDEVYLPLIGANLAKQMGTAGENKRTDLMGMLLLISPPGYGKTTLMEYIANRLGIIFMKINGPAIGHSVTSLDPQDAPNAAAKEELKKLNLSFEMGDNVMIYLDDIQHCNPEFLQKFISLCDAQRKIEGVYKGRPKTYDFRGKKVCVIMAGNPYTESGDKFQIPDMLANRADIYNLGDIIGDTEDVFKLSYVENALTSNATLAKLAGKSQKDVYTLIKVAETGNREGLEFEANHTADEINEYVNVLQKMLAIRDVVLKVNMQYIYSAAQSDDYRTEPAFKLQGSYRNMNKLAEKLSPVMNEEELETLILSHYEGESQTLTSGAEANMLKLKELTGRLSDEEAQRWEEIKKVFQKQQKLKGFGADNQMGQVLAQMEGISEGLVNIGEAIKSK